jgi:hypothetical protein
MQGWGGGSGSAMREIGVNNAVDRVIGWDGFVRERLPGRGWLVPRLAIMLAGGI